MAEVDNNRLFSRCCSSIAQGNQRCTSSCRTPTPLQLPPPSHRRCIGDLSINPSSSTSPTTTAMCGGVVAGILSVCHRRRLAGLFSMCELVGLRIPLSLSISFSALQVSRRLSYSVLRRVIRIEISLNALRTKDVILGV